MDHLNKIEVVESNVTFIVASLSKGDVNLDLHAVPSSGQKHFLLISERKR
jgi:hypothetical protein